MSKGSDVNAKDNRGETALIFASMKGHMSTIELLVSQGMI